MSISDSFLLKKIFVSKISVVFVSFKNDRHVTLIYIKQTILNVEIRVDSNGD